MAAISSGPCPASTKPDSPATADIRVFWPWLLISDATHDCGMNERDAERMLELEESAEGQSLFRAPGKQLHVEQARAQAEASDSIPESSELLDSNHTCRQRARVRRNELHRAMERLEATVARPAAPDGWAGAVDAALLELEDALTEHIREVEAPDGLLAEIVEVAPRLVAEVEMIKREHVELLRSWARARRSVTGDGVTSASGVRRRIISLLGRLAIHRQRGSDLVYEAYNTDIAAAD
jgi:hypothetical protein